MRSDWRNVRLAELGRIVTGKTPPSTVEGCFGGTTPFVTPSDYDGSKYIRHTARTLTERGEQTISGVRVPKNSVMVTCIGSDMGKAALNVAEVFTNQQINSLIVESGDLPEYVYYNLSMRKSELRTRASGSAQPILNKSAFGATEIELPSPQAQAAVVEVLRGLDDRIDLLRQTNATLESIAQALFKSWFIDFDPVRAKAEGREPEGMNAATAALFPAEFEESALGLIPKGWHASKVGEVFRITMGQSPPGETYNQEGAGVPFYQGRADFGFRFPAVRVYCTAPTRQAREGDALVSVRAPVGDVNVALESCAVGRGVAAVGLDDAQSFALYSMKALRDRFAEYESHGTVFGSINKKQFEALPCVIPSPEVLAAFSCTAGALDDRVRVNELQVRSLTDLRDSLLPRLISGTLRLPEAQAQLEEAIA